MARNFAAIPGCELTWCCDSSPEARSRIGTAIPTVRVASDIDELLRDPGLDAIAIATPVPSHAELAQVEAIAVDVVDPVPKLAGVGQ